MLLGVEYLHTDGKLVAHTTNRVLDFHSCICGRQAGIFG